MCLCIGSGVSLGATGCGIQPICVGKCGTACVDIAKDSGNETALAKKSANNTIRLISLIAYGSFKAPVSRSLKSIAPQKATHPHNISEAILGAGWRPIYSLTRRQALLSAHRSSLTPADAGTARPHPAHRKKSLQYVEFAYNAAVGVQPPRPYRTRNTFCGSPTTVSSRRCRHPHAEYFSSASLCIAASSAGDSSTYRPAFHPA